MQQRTGDNRVARDIRATETLAAGSERATDIAGAIASRPAAPSSFTPDPHKPWLVRPAPAERDSIASEVTRAHQQYLSLMAKWGLAVGALVAGGWCSLAAAGPVLHERKAGAKVAAAPQPVQRGAVVASVNVPSGR